MQIQNIYYGINSQKKNSVNEIAVKNNFTNHYSTKQLTACDSLDLCNEKNSSSQVCFNGLLDFFKKKNTKRTRQEAREKLLSYKTPDGTYRFNGKDCSDLVEVYHDDPDTVNYFINMKKADGTPLLTSGYEISEYAKKYKECPQAVNSFFNKRNPDGSLRYNILALDIYTSNHLKYPAEQEELLNIRVRDNKQISLFDINILAEAYKKYPEEVIYLLNLKNPEGTITLADEGKMRSYIEAGYLYEVGSMAFGNPWRELNVETISQLAEPLHNNPEKVKQILNSTYEYTIGEKYDYDTVSRLERGYHKNLKVNFNYIMAPYKNIKVLLSDADILEKVNSL